MTKDEALKLALEALLSWGKGFPDNWGDLDTEAITAIKEALAQQETPNEIGKRVAREGGGLSSLWSAVSHDSDLPEAQRGYEEALAQPEQEPVAWIHNHIKGNVIAHRPATLDRHPDHWTALYPEPKPCPTCEALARTVMLDQTSHDTTPPQRTWVGLTEKDILEAAVKSQEGISPRNDTLRFAVAIEAKLKEKNT